jgi:hypothetical protein
VTFSTGFLAGVSCSSSLNVTWVREGTAACRRSYYQLLRCHVVSVTDPYGLILGFLDRRRYFFFQIAPQLYSRDWVDPVPDPLLRKSGSAGNRTRNLWICNQEHWPLNQRGGSSWLPPVNVCCIFVHLGHYNESGKLSLYSDGLTRSGWPGFDFRYDKIFCFSTVLRFAVELTKRRFPCRINRPGHETDYSPPSNAEIKNGGDRSPFSHVFMAKVKK